APRALYVSFLDGLAKGREERLGLRDVIPGGSLRVDLLQELAHALSCLFAAVGVGRGAGGGQHAGEQDKKAQENENAGARERERARRCTCHVRAVPRSNARHSSLPNRGTALPRRALSAFERGRW